MVKGLTAATFALWVVAIAILSVQNATPVSIRFLAFRSVPLPFGVVLSIGAAGGMLLTAAVLSLASNGKSSSR